MPSIREAFGFILFLIGGGLLAYAFYKEEKRRVSIALTLASYFLIGAIIYGWSDLVVPKSIKGPGFELTTIQREIAKTKDESLEEIRRESATQKADIETLRSGLRDETNLIIQTKDQLKSEVDQGNALISTLRTEQDKLNREVGSLHQEVKARSLSAAQERQLRTVLCKTPHSVVLSIPGHSLFGGGDKEVWAFADQIFGIFKACGWSAPDGPVIKSALKEGVRVVYWGKSPWAKDFAIAISQVLKSSGQATVEQMPSQATVDKRGMEADPRTDPSNLFRADLELAIGSKPLIR